MRDDMGPVDRLVDEQARRDRRARAWSWVLLVVSGFVIAGLLVYGALA